VKDLNILGKIKSQQTLWLQPGLTAD